jgi:hypothetical protein
MLKLASWSMIALKRVSKKAMPARVRPYNEQTSHLF